MIPDTGLRLVKSDRNPHEIVSLDLSKIYQDRLEKHLAAAIQHARGETVLLYPDQFTQDLRDQIRLIAKMVVAASMEAPMKLAHEEASEAVTKFLNKDYASMSQSQRDYIHAMVTVVWAAMTASLAGVGESK